MIERDETIYEVQVSNYCNVVLAITNHDEAASVRNATDQLVPHTPPPGTTDGRVQGGYALPSDPNPGDTPQPQGQGVEDGKAHPLDALRDQEEIYNLAPHTNQSSGAPAAQRQGPRVARCQWTWQLSV